MPVDQNAQATAEAATDRFLNRLIGVDAPAPEPRTRAPEPPPVLDEPEEPEAVEAQAEMPDITMPSAGTGETPVETVASERPTAGVDADFLKRPDIRRAMERLIERTGRSADAVLNMVHANPENFEAMAAMLPDEVKADEKLPDTVLPESLAKNFTKDEAAAIQSLISSQVKAATDAHSGMVVKMTRMLADVVAEQVRPQIVATFPEVKDAASWAKVRKVADDLGNAGVPGGPMSLLKQAALLEFGARRQAAIDQHAAKVEAAKRRETPLAPTQTRETKPPVTGPQAAEKETDAILDELLVGKRSRDEIVSMAHAGKFKF